MISKTGSYSKFIVTIYGVIATYINTYYASAHWATLAIAGLTALSVYLVPNQGVNNDGILPNVKREYTSKPPS
jgi:hypothetical protein